MAPEPTPQNKRRVALGLLAFGPLGSEPHGSRITSLLTFNECLDYYQSQGYHEVDTARTYINGLQESFTRAANWRQRNLSVATKCYPTSPGTHSKSAIKKQLEKSLSELGSDQVDVFYLHALDRSVAFEETLDGCNELYQAGKFKQLGLSNFVAWEVADIDIVGCNPLAGGMLSGKYKTNETPSEGRYPETDQSVGKMYRERYFRDAKFDALRMLDPVAREHGLTLPEIAFRWYVHHSKLNVIAGNDGIVIGISSIDQLRSNLVDIEKGPLPDKVVLVLDEIWQKVTKTTCPLYWR